MESPPLAVGATDGRDEFFQSLAHLLARRVVHTLAEVSDRALPVALVSVETLTESHLALDAVEEGIAHLLRQLGERSLLVRAEVFDDGEERTLHVGRALLVGGGEGQEEFVGALGRVGDDFGRVNFKNRAEAVAAFARAVDRVEGERARLQRRDVDAADDAGHALRVEFFLAVNDRDEHRAARQFERRADGFGQTLVDAGLDEQAVNHRLDGVVAPLIELNLFVERQQFAVDARAEEAVFSQLLKLLLELALAAADDGGEHHHALAFR